VGDKNRATQEYMSMNLKEMQMFCEKLFAEYTKENGKTAALKC
jgi:hypothetical protein